MANTNDRVDVLLSGIRMPLDATEQEILAHARKKMKRAGISPASLHFRLYKKSVDARHRNDIRLVYSVLVQSEDGTALNAIPEQALISCGGKRIQRESMSLTGGNVPMQGRPLVVGMGPAGMFCALLLAEHGYAPIVIDRGDDVEQRVQAVERLVRYGVLDTDSNIQFGAGGAGTFSDGKLLTRINDARCQYVLERLHAFGAPDEILSCAKPHIGTDVLRTVVQRLLKRIEDCGGSLHYRTRLIGFRENGDGSITAHTTAGDMACGALVLALGHSARDSYQMLIEKQFSVIPKPISVGVRVEHLQSDIDAALYGEAAGHPALGHAEYALSETGGARGVYTFCMCPGGEVVAAASEEGGVVVNGMSHYARDGRNANCAVAVSIQCEDYEPVDGNAALGAIAYQRRIEQAAYRLGGGDYTAPIQTMGDFLSGEGAHEPSRITPSYRGGEHVRVAQLSQLFPSYVTQSLRAGFRSFERKLHGFCCADAVLTAAETRTSAPVRILRDEQGLALGHAAIYPCGEGAGYAGGITSAAVDGLRIATAIIQRYAPTQG